MPNEDETVRHETVPEALKTLPRWLCWRYEERDGKTTKVPYDPRSGRRASSTDPSTWTDFDTALAAAPDYDGVGIVLGDGLAGIDLDNSIDETGDLKPWAADIVRRLNSYAEISPSGGGAKVFLMGRVDRDGNRRDIGDGHVELYWQDRYFTVTGRHLDGAPADVRDRQGELRALHLDLFPLKEQPAPQPADPPDLSDRELLDRMFAASNGAGIRRLWQGEIDGYPSHSEADAALCAHLAFWTGGDRDRIDRLFRCSGLCRDKWTDRPDYRERTIDVALKGLGDSYRPRAPDPAAVDISGIAGPEPEMPAPENPDPGLLPEELLRVPGFIGEVMDYTLDTAPYPNRVLAFGGALTLLGFLCSRRVRDPGDNRTNLYVLGLANSGAGKEHPRKVNQRILMAIGLQGCLGDAFASWQGIEDQLHVQPSMLFQTDEIDGLMVAIKEGKEARFENLMKMLTKLYTSSNGVYPMRVKADREHKVINQPSLCIFGTAIPQHYYEALSVDMLTNGFVARMLVLESGPRGKGQEPSVRDIPDRILEVARWWMEFRPGPGDLEKWNPKPKEVEQTPEAQDALRQVRTRAEAEYADAEVAQDVVRMTVWARASENTRRLALIYACSEDHENPAISEDAVEWGWAFVRHQTRRLLFMSSEHVSENKFHAMCKRLVRVLRDWKEKRGNAWMPFWKLNRKVPWSAREHEEVRTTLQNQHIIDYVEKPTGGTPKRLYRLL